MSGARLAAAARVQALRDGPQTVSEVARIRGLNPAW
jgi:hypothetical protein